MLGELFLADNELLDVAALPQVLGKFGKLLMNAPHDLAVQFLRGRASAYLRLRRKVNLLRGIGRQLGMALKRLNRPRCAGRPRAASSPPSVPNSDGECRES